MNKWKTEDRQPKASQVAVTLDDRNWWVDGSYPFKTLGNVSYQYQVDDWRRLFEERRWTVSTHLLRLPTVEHGHKRSHRAFVDLNQAFTLKVSWIQSTIMTRIVS